MNNNCDVSIIGAGHNGLVASILLARAGLSVKMFESSGAIGGAARTEYPFKKAPELGHSTGAYLLGVMPPELIAELGLNIKLVRRDPHYFLPTLEDKYLLLGADSDKNDHQIKTFFSEKDAAAVKALEREIGMIRDDLAPAWLKEPFSLEITAEKFIRPELQSVFVDLCKNPVEEYLDRFEFKSELLLAMYAVTDGFSGLNASFGMMGTGHNFLAHNMCRLPNSGGTWMIAEGGMGAVTQGLMNIAIKEGVEIKKDSPVESVAITANTVSGLHLKNGEKIHSKVVLGACDPYKLLQMTEGQIPSSFSSSIKDKQKSGTTLKLNLALDGLPTFTCLPERLGQHRTTSHLLPSEKDGSILNQVRQSYEDVQSGKLADFPTIEWYFHTDAEPSLQDAQGRHSAALFVQWAPYEIKGSSWDAERGNYEKHLIEIASRFAPDLPDKIADTFMLAPPDLESYFGITGGHIHHVDNAYSFDQRVPYGWPIDGLYAGSAGCFPGGSVIGCAGHNAAKRIIKDLSID